jgi:lysozyme family protein
MALPGPAIDLVLRHEGGLSDDSSDPGGLTNFGISIKSYPQLGEEGIRSLTRAQAGSIYQRDFWTPTMAAQTDQRLANCMLDCRVNQGPGVEGRIYQKGVSLIDFQIARLLRYVSIVAQNPAELKFLGGWFRRTLDVG